MGGRARKVSEFEVGQEYTEKSSGSERQPGQNKTTAGQWWHMPLFTALQAKTGRYVSSEFKASLIYRVCYRTSRATKRKLCLGKQKN